MFNLFKKKYESPTILGTLSECFNNAARPFEIVNPGIPSVFSGKMPRMIFKGLSWGSSIKRVVVDGKRIDEELGDRFGKTLTSIPLNPIKKMTSKGHSIAQIKRGSNTRGWFHRDGDSFKSRIVRRLNVMYHDANRAGKHVDLHIGQLSMIYRISGKPVENLILFDKNGKLTAGSKLAILNHIKDEISKNARVPQNLDHTVARAMETWMYDERLREKTGYGVGTTRQPVVQGMCEIINMDNEPGGMLRIYSPDLNKHGIMFLRELYPGTRSKSPILLFGNKKLDFPNLEDRLHLLSIKPNHLDDLLKKLNEYTATEKEDGASVYTVIGNRLSYFWSPRISKETGHRINYTLKLPEFSRIKSDREIVGMGELVFHKVGPLWVRKKLTAAEIGGILNSDKIRPWNIIPSIRFYRVDKFDGKKVHDIPFEENRELQKMVASLHKNFHITKDIKPVIKKGMEGIVIFQRGKPVGDGIKIKFVDDPCDWIVESVNLSVSPKERITGTVRFKSLESCRSFNLGPGQIGNFDECKMIMDNPDQFIGRIAKVISRVGHEGRASKLSEWHMDK